MTADHHCSLQSLANKIGENREMNAGIIIRDKTIADIDIISEVTMTAFKTLVNIENNRANMLDNNVVSMKIKG